MYELYYLELATGLRRGELLGLNWEDIDLERGDLRVKRQIARINGEVVEPPENEKRLPHPAAGRGYDRRPESTEKESRGQSLGIPQPHR